MKRLLVALCVAGTLVACGKRAEEAPAAGFSPEPSASASGTFASIEAEILVPRCASQPGCHLGSAPAGRLDLEAGVALGNLVGVKAERRSERLRVAPGDPAASYLVQRLEPGHDTPLMPLGGDPLPAGELNRIKEWIAQGAKP